MKIWNEIKSSVYTQLKYILQLNFCGTYNEKIHDKIIKDCEDVVKPYIEDKTLYDVKFVCDYDESQNKLMFSFAWKIENKPDFTYINFEVTNDKKTQQETKQIKKEIPHKGFKGMIKGIICLLFGHDWVSYNEHAWICSRCMEVAPKG